MNVTEKNKVEWGQTGPKYVANRSLVQGSPEWLAARAFHTELQVGHVSTASRAVHKCLSASAVK